ncbi:anther-specific protein RTS-like [Phragmites australis]|uniref:anther-specific protein RTS-like n=1 Tax=Phragmites australis TaxID=29695 RepID=UPI002D78DA8D|nr:anther-specific protein RTS-like [Phragmites australis]
MKAPAAAMLLLALVVAAAAVTPSDAAGHPTAGGTANPSRRRHGHHRSRDDQSPLTGLTQCVTICGSQVTTCLLDCYGPLSRGNPVALPVCLLSCTNDAMVCASGCSTDVVDGLTRPINN